MRNHIHKMIEASIVLLLVLVKIALCTELSDKYRLHKFPEILGITDYTKLIQVNLLGNPIKPGDNVPVKNFKNLDLSKISWNENDPDTRHTLLLLDLDRKLGSNNTATFYNQFTSLNIPGNAISGGQIITAFDPPSVPCVPSTKHRVALLVYSQKQNIDIMSMKDIAASAGPSKNRENFALAKFVELHDLELQAANVFFAAGDINGICSASATVHSFAIFQPVLMVMLASFIGSFGLDRRNVKV